MTLEPTLRRWGIDGVKLGSDPEQGDHPPCSESYVANPPSVMTQDIGILGALGIANRNPRRPTPAQMAAIWACCAAVSWMTFLGLQFQMDCVGPVSFLS